MPVASHIAVLPARALPRMSAKGGPASGKSGGHDFGQVLRQQAGQAPSAVQPAQPAGATNAGLAGFSGVRPAHDAGQVEGQIGDKLPGQILDKLPGLPGQVQATDATTAPQDLGHISQSKEQAQGNLHAGAAALTADIAAKNAVPGSIGKQAAEEVDSNPGSPVKAKEGKSEAEGKDDKKGKIDAARPGTKKLAGPLPAALLSSLSTIPAVGTSIAALPAGQKVRAANAAQPVSGQSALFGQAKAPAKATQSSPAGKGIPAPGGMAQGIQPGVQPGGDPGIGIQPEATSEAGAAPSTGTRGSGSSKAPRSVDRQDASTTAARVAFVAQHADSGVSVAAHHFSMPGTGDAAAHLSIPVQSSSTGVAAPTPVAAPLASPYDRIDQGVGSAPVMLHSGAQHMAVGLHDPHLGWVEIQTQNAAGHVDATLVAASGQTHDSLAAQLPAISQFLEQREVRVGTLTVHHQSAGGGTSSGSGSGSGFGAGSGSSSGSGANGYGNGGAGAGHSGSRAGRFTGVIPGRYRSVPVARLGAADDAALPRAVSYISVRA